MDHGIAGGDSLYGGLIENYNREYRQNRISGTYERFLNTQGREFCCEQFKVFAYIANCVTAHNIFMAEGDEAKKVYQHYGLECLWKENFKKISYEENPLLFVLCVADTLEPLKRFKGEEPSDILKKITLDYNFIENFITVKMEEDIKYSENGKKYIDNIKKMEEWCKIKVKID